MLIVRTLTKAGLKRIFEVSSATLRRNFLNQQCYESCLSDLMTYNEFLRRKTFYLVEAERLVEFFKLDIEELKT